MSEKEEYQKRIELSNKLTDIKVQEEQIMDTMIDQYKKELLTFEERLQLHNIQYSKNPPF